MGHRENGQHEHENEVSDVLYHVNQHSNVVARIPEDPKEVEEPDPHYNGGEGIQGAHD